MSQELSCKLSFAIDNQCDTRDETACDKYGLRRKDRRYVKQGLSYLGV